MKDQVTNSFYRCEDIKKILHIKESKAYKIMHTLNKELEEKGYITVSGRVPKKYFHERLGLEL